MVWRKYTIHTTTEAEEILAANLADLGIEGVQIEDKQPLSEADTKGMFIDILPDLGPDDGKAMVSFYVEVLEEEEKEIRLQEAAVQAEDPSIDASYTFNTGNLYTEEELAELLEQIGEEIDAMRQYCDVGEGSIEISETEDKDWINNWKTFFHPFTVDDILIKPTWEEIPEEHRDKLLIQIDPGTAFGTGMHETTQLCIRQLKKYMKEGDRVCDLGTGSGILGITALKLGASSVMGTDLDEEAVPAVHGNMEANALPEESFGLIIGNVIGDREVQDQLGYACYDIVVANILAPVIVMLTDVVAPHLKQGGMFITSGIIQEKEEEVFAAFRAHEDVFEVVEVNHQGEWVNITARRR